jgi:hypothetical protein
LAVKPDRELSIGALFNSVFILYRKHFVILYVPILVSSLVTLGTSSYLLHVFAKSFVAPSMTAPVSVMASWLSSLIVALVGTIAILGVEEWILGAVVYGTCVKIASDSVETGTASLGKAFTFTLGKLLPLLVATLVVGIVVGIGTVLFVIPGIIFAIMFYLIVPSILVEGTGAMQGLSRSRKLVKGRWLKTFAFLLVIGLITIIVSEIGNFVSAPFGVASWIARSIVDSLATMIYPISLAVYYYSMVAREKMASSPPPSF